MIGGTLEYLISSLPNLSFNNTGEFRKSVSAILEKYSGMDAENINFVDALNEEAFKFLSPHEYELFCQVKLENIMDESFQNSNNQLLSEFSKFNVSLKESVKQLRLNRRDKKSSQKEQDGFITPGNPLEEENQIIKYQWDALEELSIDHYADFTALLSYKLKLLILIRWWSFNKEKGFARLQAASEPIMRGGGHG